VPNITDATKEELLNADSANISRETGNTSSHAREQEQQSIETNPLIAYLDSYITWDVLLQRTPRT
jgi:hypothetical protein